MKSVKMSKIPRFREVVSTINRSYNYKGKDDEGNAIYDDTAVKPTVVFEGTVKIHGTNAGVLYSKGELYAQKKSGLCTVEKDNFGFAFFVESNKKVIKELIKTVVEKAGINIEENAIVLNGEWAGKGVQKGVAISKMDKSFFIFGAKVVPYKEDEYSYWLKSSLFDEIDSPDNRIYNLHKLTKHKVNIDFNNPVSIGKAQETFEKLTLEVERECPIAKVFGHSGIGEGLVWTGRWRDNFLRFKTKGQKHSVSKVKKVASIDVEKLETIQEFVKYASTDNRFKQALSEVFGKEEPIINKMGDLIRWVVTDVMAEEKDTLKENNLEPKDVNKYLSKDVRDRFKKYLNENLY